ncbi:thermonuclease family protein [Mycoplasma sp. 'Moose RK']|nr:thermonuclease family protein [Mycoplasma sp. 'Moose RK']
MSRLKLFFSLTLLTSVPFFTISCLEKTSTSFNFTNAQKYYQIETFSKNPFDDLNNSQSEYAKNVAKFLDEKYKWTEKDKQKFKNDVLPNSEFFAIVPAKIENWTDGDTVQINPLKTDLLPKSFSVRLESIDTPEIGSFVGGKYRKTVGLEKKYADQAKQFAEKILPKNTKILFVFTKPKPAQSYSRLVGNIYFGHDNFYKNYNVEVIKAGLAVPTLQLGLAGVTNKTAIYHYSSIKQAAALENSINHKFGIYQELQGAEFISITNVLDMVYKTRGITNIADFLVLETNRDKNVFDYYEFYLKQNYGKAN